MKIVSLDLENVRVFEGNINKLEFSKSINILIGQNNTGKTTILNSILHPQKPVLSRNDITKGKTEGNIRIVFTENLKYSLNDFERVEFIDFSLRTGENTFKIENKSYSNFLSLPSQEPNNLFYPYLSKRKVNIYDPNINENSSNSVTGTLEFLVNKIDRVNQPQRKPHFDEYKSSCNKILGFEIGTAASGIGKKIVYYSDGVETIPLDSMGEGVANILGLIVDLCEAKNKIFVIEEIENDIHPKALKELLALIIEKSKTNQFFISTHSNIVMKYLGGNEGSKIFNIRSQKGNSLKPELFTSKILELKTYEERREALEDLGYELFDSDLYEGWLFLEESSAERIIRDYFIKWFVPSLENKIKTFSAGGSTSITPKFDNFNRLFVFVHLHEHVYKNKVWVIIDGGKEEQGIISEMKEKYLKSGWKESHFSQFVKHDFECYYPEEFNNEVSEIILIKDKQKRREAKKNLLNNVLAWIDKNNESAKEKFKISAKEVIDKLEQIEKEISN